MSRNFHKMKIYSFGHKYLIPEIKENDLYVDVRDLKKFNTDIKNVGTDKVTRRKYLRNPDIRDFYEKNILFVVRENDFNSVYIGCHQGKHKSVCLAEQLFIDMEKRVKNITLKHITIDF